MTTIDEMEEFFDFEDAAHSHPFTPSAHIDFDFDSTDFASGQYDFNQDFAQEAQDDNELTCLQLCSSPGIQPEQNMLAEVQGGTAMDTDVMGPDDFTDFPRWIDGMDVPTKPCSYCLRMRIHCKVIKEGLRKGSCTSCVALARSCSLTHDPVYPKNDYFRCSPSKFCLPGNTVNDDGSALFLPDIPAEQTASDWNPIKSPLQSSSTSLHNQSMTNLVRTESPDENINITADLGENSAKVNSARFSRESVRVLRGWLSTHHRHPYPTDEEKESLRRQTGLNKTQITNWLANARRRGKVRAPRSTSPSVHNYANAIDIPRRTAKPALQNMNPLERWKNSPPENEPASVTAIAKAVTNTPFSSGHESPYTSYGHTDDGSGLSICNVSSASSFGTSHSSSRSFASAFSHKSQGSLGSFGSFGQRGRRRRRRQAPNQVKVPTNRGPARAFQCTFCTETFKTKHDWQRHEKSLHLSLERWVCCPNGPTQFCSDSNCKQCVFCGLSNPPRDHAEIHSYLSCADRNLEERTFYRKDHLRQHLNLVHDVKFQGSSMDSWKVASPEIRSRCGFCGIVMDSWSSRVDHLAEHFKGGKSMADWRGDWGFESQVLDIVENGMPPYLIHDERNSLEPFEASKDLISPASVRTMEDLVKIGLVEHIHGIVIKGGLLTDEDLLAEARKIVQRVDGFSPDAPQVSWFRDLIMLSGNYTPPGGSPDQGNAVVEHLQWEKELQLQTIQGPHDDMDISSISCTKERQLKAFVFSKQMLGTIATDSELQVEACRILDEVEITSNFKCKEGLVWFKYLVSASKGWLTNFRRRAGLPHSSEMDYDDTRSMDDNSSNYSIQHHGKLENGMKAYVRLQIATGFHPSDQDIQHHARKILYKSDDPSNQTVMDTPSILHLFKRQNGLAPDNDDGPDLPPLPEASENFIPSPKTLHWDMEQSGIVLQSLGSSSSSIDTGTNTSGLDQPLHTIIQNQPSTNTNPTQPLKYFLNDANCYGRLVRELSRFVTTCTSVNNPNRHVPSDAEIQNQARWVIYDDDDPWNQTAADNAEWLIRFKRDVGLAAPEEGPGLPVPNSSWQVNMGGSGFSPPYLLAEKPPTHLISNVSVRMEDKLYPVKTATAQKFMKGMSERYEPPGKVFCSRELERGLNDFVFGQVAKGIRPTDNQIREEARQILGTENTAADDLHLLEKFKAMHGFVGSSTPLLSNFTAEEILAELDQELAVSGFSNTNLDIQLMG